jgi:hypothetical protein
MEESTLLDLTRRIDCWPNNCQSARQGPTETGPFEHVKFDNGHDYGHLFVGKDVL